MSNLSFSQWTDTQRDDSLTIFDNDIARGATIGEAIFVRRLLWMWSRGDFRECGMLIVQKSFCMPMGMTKYRYEKIIKNWKASRLISIKFRGKPAKNYIKINEKRMAKYLNKVKEKGTEKSVIHHERQGFRKRKAKDTSLAPRVSKTESSPIGSPYGGTHRYTKSINNPGPLARVVVVEASDLPGSKNWPITQEPNGPDERRAHRLIKLIQEANHVRRRFSERGWSNTIKRIHVADGHTTQEVDAVLSFFKKHAKDQYAPKIFSALSFREKFPACLAYMQKHGGGQGEDAPICDRAKREAGYLRGAPYEVTPQILANHAESLNAIWREIKELEAKGVKKETARMLATMRRYRQSKWTFAVWVVKQRGASFERITLNSRLFEEFWLHTITGYRCYLPTLHKFIAGNG